MKIPSLSDRIKRVPKILEHLIHKEGKSEFVSKFSSEIQHYLQYATLTVEEMEKKDKKGHKEISLLIDKCFEIFNLNTMTDLDMKKASKLEFYFIVNYNVFNSICAIK